MKSKKLQQRINEVRGIASRNKAILENFSYISLLRVFVLLAPLLTYPYLNRVLGLELYGLVITAQILASYATIIVRFGFDKVSARHISIHRDDKNKLSEIMSSILGMRGVLWVLSFIFYVIIVMLVSAYREHFLLFFFSYGLTLEVLLFPQFFFQGIEKMKYITIVNVLIQAVFVILTFVVIRRPSDYVFVPLLHTAGYLIGGLISLYIIINKYDVRLHRLRRQESFFYFKDALPLFATDAVSTFKDKLNYILLGLCAGMGNVIPYDVGAKITSLVLEPYSIVNMVLFPKMAKDKDDKQFKRVFLYLFPLIVTLVVIANIFLHPIVSFLVGQEVDLLPIRFYLLSPLFLGIGGYISQNLIVARGYNRYQLISIIITTIAYLVALLVLYSTHHLNTVMAFVGLTVFSYLVEMVYRIYIARKILNKTIA